MRRFSAAFIVIAFAASARAVEVAPIGKMEMPAAPQEAAIGAAAISGGFSALPADTGLAPAAMPPLETFAAPAAAESDADGKPGEVNDPGRPMFDNGAAPKGSADPASASAQPNAPLAQAFVNSLLEYHRLDGHKDNSPLSGVQYPPLSQVNQGDEMSLKAFINDLSRYLASQPGIEHKPAPKDQPARAEFRRQIAQAAAQEIRAHVNEEFQAVVDGIQNPNLKAFLKKALAQAQPEFWRAPSSSSGKYHPADEINYGGLMLHTVRNVIVGRMMGRYLGIDAHTQEVIDVASILHDVQKGGIPWRHDQRPGDAPDSGYVADHGPVAAHWLKEFADECGANCDQIIAAVDHHMAQWNKPAPTPAHTLVDQMVSYADYLASQNDVYVRWRGADSAPESVGKAKGRLGGLMLAGPILAGTSAATAISAATVIKIIFGLMGGMLGLAAGAVIGIFIGANVTGNYESRGTIAAALIAAALFAALGAWGAVLLI